MPSRLALATQYIRSAVSADKAEQAIYPIEKLISAEKITPEAVHQLQQETLNPRIDNLLGRPENDPGRQRLCERVAVLNQRLLKDRLPTMRVDRLTPQLTLKQALDEAIALDKAIEEIDALIAAEKITVETVEKLQKKTLNPLIDNLLDRPENDPRGRLIYEKLTVLNKRLRKEHLPTVGIDRLSMLPQEVFSAIFEQLGHYSEGAAKCSRAIAQRQEDFTIYCAYEKNLQAGLGEERFEELKQKCNLPENADVKTRVKAIYAALRAEVRKINGGKDPVFKQNPNPLSIEEITLLNDYKVESGRSVIALAQDAHKAHHRTAMVFPDEVSTEEQRADFARKWLADNQDTVRSITVLQLGSKNIKVIPPEIGQFKALKTLILQHNHIEVIPPEIGQLTALQKLDLTWNQIEVISPEIGQLTALTLLFLGNNKIEVIPPEIGQLTALKQLDLFSNEIAVIPPEIGKLTALTLLALFNNKIAVIPPELKRPGLGICISAD